MTAPRDDALVIRRRVRATADELFAEWTTPENMGEWMCPGDIVSTEVHMDLRVGGVLRIVMRDAKTTYEHRGEFTVIEPPAKLAFTWIAAATDHKKTLVTVEFIPISEFETELVLTHRDFPRPEVRERYRGGWARILERLDEHLQARRA
jgi:uncharacterized protein YndB with AHSA1/START domain